MDLILEVRTGREQATLVCHGKLLGGKEADVFRSSAILLMGAFEKLIINFAGVRTVDGGGLGSLVGVLAAAVDKGRQVRIIHACSLVREMLAATNRERCLDPRSGPGPQLVTKIQDSVA